MSRLLGSNLIIIISIVTFVLGFFIARAGWLQMRCKSNPRYDRDGRYIHLSGHRALVIDETGEEVEPRL